MKGHFTPHSEETRKKISKILLGKNLGNTYGFKKGHTLTKGRPAPWARNNPQVFKKGMKTWNVGTSKIKERPCLNCGKVFMPSKHKDERKFCSTSCFHKSRTGEQNNMWKGGITAENDTIRTSIEMKLWKKACLERDNFTDQKTGIRGGDLVVHHINNFADFPELRTSIENGIVLSKESHNLFHKKYGKRNNTREQLYEFLDNPS